MEKLTFKQFNYLLSLGAQEDEIRDLTIKEASIKIGQYVKAAKEAKQAQKAARKKTVAPERKDFTEQDLENLLKKYNAKYEMAQSGFYRNDKGSNRSSELLKDSRKFKSYILNVIKTEFNNIKVKKCSCSFEHYYNKHIDLVIEAPKEMIYKPFEDVLSNYKLNNNYNTFEVLRYHFYSYKCAKWTSLENATEKRIYDLYYKNIKHEYTLYSNLRHQRNSSILNDTFKNILAFIHELLLSFSYDNSSPETDYFDHGLEDNIAFVASDIDENQALEFEEIIKNANDEKDVLIKYPVTEAENAELKKAVEAYQEAWQKEQERINKEIEESNRKAREWAEEQKKNSEYISQYVEVKKLDETLILRGSRFSTWNKPCTLDEAIEFIENQPEDKEIGTIAIIKEVINFSDEKAYDLFTKSLLNDYSFLQGVGCGCGHVDYDTLEDKDYNECYNLSLEQQHAKNIAWARNSVIIALNGDYRFLVDTEGASYCRYVGLLPDGSKTAPVVNENFLTSEEEKELDYYKNSCGNEIEVYDFGAKRNYSENFWNELRKYGDVVFNKYSWKFIKKIKKASA